MSELAGAPNIAVDLSVIGGAVIHRHVASEGEVVRELVHFIFGLDRRALQLLQARLGGAVVAIAHQEAGAPLIDGEEVRAVTRTERA